MRLLMAKAVDMVITSTVSQLCCVGTRPVAGDASAWLSAAVLLLLFAISTLMPWCEVVHVGLPCSSLWLRIRSAAS